MVGNGHPASGLRAHSMALLDTLAEHVEVLEQRRPDANLEILRVFLREELLPYVHAEELHLYPTLETIVRTHGHSTALLLADHDVISRLVHRIVDLIYWLETAPTAETALSLETELRTLAVKLKAVVGLHVEREQAYLQLFEEHLSVEQQQRILADMETRERTEALAT